MGCLFNCFRAADGEPRARHARAHLVSSSLAPSANPKVSSSCCSSSCVMPPTQNPCVPVPGHGSASRVSKSEKQLINFVYLSVLIKVK